MSTRSRLAILPLLDQLLERLNAFRAERILSRCASVGEGVRLRMPVTVYYPEKLSFGSQVDVGEYSLLRAMGGITVGSRVLIASHVVINSGAHPVELPRYGVNVEGKIDIADDVWIGTGAVILAGVSIGRGSVIGAGAVVTKSVAPYTVVAGVPARTIRRIERGRSSRRRSGAVAGSV